MIKPILNDGESYVEGRGEEVARKLYEQAEKAGVDVSRIFTTSHGYVVPSELVAEADEQEAEEAPEETPDETSDEAPKEADDDGAFDPAEHTVAEVKAHLADADDEERARVLELESKSESPRAGVLKLGEGDK